MGSDGDDWQRWVAPLPGILAADAEELLARAAEHQAASVAVAVADDVDFVCRLARGMVDREGAWHRPLPHRVPPQHMHYRGAALPG
ncbi:hypothetical protein [Streptomyces sp. NPDC006307]|uniref:hypothetical protein n=1 Tax=Streptomyces sp. NPDC006307 TaxID=3156748 RepID=UPI0033AF2A24